MFYRVLYLVLFSPGWSLLVCFGAMVRCRTASQTDPQPHLHVIKSYKYS